MSYRLLTCYRMFDTPVIGSLGDRNKTAVILRHESPEDRNCVKEEEIEKTELVETHWRVLQVPCTRKPPRDHFVLMYGTHAALGKCYLEVSSIAVHGSPDVPLTMPA